MTTKARKTGKRCLALFMTVLMLMSAWVFVAPTKASALSSQTAGKYYVKVYWHVDDDSNKSDNTWKLNWRAQDGSTGTYEYGNNNAASSTGDKESSVLELNGVPYSIFYQLHNSGGFGIGGCGWYIKKITIANNNSMTGAVSLWEGTLGCKCENIAAQTINVTYNIETNTQGSWSNGNGSNKTQSTSYLHDPFRPTPSCTYSGHTVVGLNGAQETRTYSIATAKDQYGVNWGFNSVTWASSNTTLAPVSTSNGNCTATFKLNNEVQYNVTLTPTLVHTSGNKTPTGLTVTVDPGKSMSLNTQYNVSNNNSSNVKWYAFKPSETGTYIFFSWFDSGPDVNINLYQRNTSNNDEVGSSIAYGDDLASSSYGNHTGNSSTSVQNKNFNGGLVQKLIGSSSYYPFYCVVNLTKDNVYLAKISGLNGTAIPFKVCKAVNITFNATGGLGKNDNDADVSSMTVPMPVGHTTMKMNQTGFTRTGHTLLAWSTTSSETQPKTCWPSDTITVPSSATTYYALWNPNDGTPTDLALYTDYTANIDHEYEVQFYQFIPPETGYYAVFSHNSSSSPDPYLLLLKKADWASSATVWKSDDDGNGNHQFYLSEELQKDVPYLIAVKLYDDGTGTYPFRIESVFKVRYYGNGGSDTVSNVPAEQDKRFDVNLTLSSTQPTRTGYTFQGWATHPSATTVDYAPGATYTANANLDLYAVWTPNQSTLTVNPNNGVWEHSSSNQSFTQAYNTTKSIPDPTRVGYSFSSWTLGGSGNGTFNSSSKIFTFGSSTAARTLTANWSRNSYQVTYPGEHTSGTPGSVDGAASLSATVNAAANYHLTDNVTVKVGNKTLTRDTDYTYTLSSNHRSATVAINADLIGDNVTINAVAEACSGGTATCTQAATCSVCNTAYGSTDSNNHDWDYANATFNWSGYTCPNATVHCTRDTNHTTQVATTVTSVTTAPAVCNANGTKVYTAKFIANDTEYTSTKTETLTDTSNHDYITVPSASHLKTAATCTTAAVYYKYCSRCGANHPTETFTSGNPDANAHTWGSWTQVDENTHKRVCANSADHVQIENHSWTAGTATPATCTAAGSQPYSCATCGGTKTETIPVLGHNFTGSWTERTPATCTTAGVEFRVCARTGCSVEETRDIPAFGHTLITVAEVPPHCNQPGTYSYTYCDTCKLILIRDNVDVTANNWTTTANASELVWTDTTAHNWSAWSETTPATCTAAGVESRTCSYCGQTETNPIPALGHDVHMIAPVNPTCMTPGNYSYTYCDRCKKVLTINFADVTSQNITYNNATPSQAVWTDANAHNYGAFVETTAATCTEDGLLTSTCSYNSSHTQTKVIPKLGHDWGDWTVTTAATCTTDGVETRVCANDTNHEHDETRPIPKTGHNWTSWTVTVPATCTANGTETRTCQNSGCSETETRTIPKLDHNWSAWTDLGETQGHSRTCSVGSETETEAHTWTNVVNPDALVAASSNPCAAGVSYYKTCSVCGRISTDANNTFTTQTAGHRLVAVPAQAATCTEAGHEAYWQCAVCNKYFSDANAANEISAPVTTTALGHNFDTTATPIEGTNGHMYQCTRCGGYGYGNALGNVQAHTFNQQNRGNRYIAGAATDCGQTATYYYSCVCGAVGTTTFSDQSGTLNHNLTAHPAVAATCAAEGRIAYWECSRCHRLFSDANGTTEVHADALSVPKSTTHSFGNWETVTAATCTQPGSEKQVCSVCGKIELRDTAVGHHSFTSTTYRTNNNGTHSVKCINCDVYGPDVTCTNTTSTSTAADCLHQGTTTYTCSDCHGSWTVTGTYGTHTGMTNHPAVAPSCTTDGTVEYWTCSVCNKYFSDAAGSNERTLAELTDPATGHTMTLTPANAADCTRAGNTAYYTCSTCGHYFSDALGQYEITANSWNVAALGHNWGEWTVTTQPSCTAAGVETRECARCHITETRYPVATGHKLVFVPAVAPTCTADGSLANYTCALCGKHFSDAAGTTEMATIVDPALGHDFDTTGTPVEHGTGHYYKCTRCGEYGFNGVVGATTTHSYTVQNNGAIYAKDGSAADCTHQGEFYYSCACGANEHDDNHTFFAGGSLGHVLRHFAAVTATCKDDGNLEYWYCSRCGNYYSDANANTQTTLAAVTISHTTIAHTMPNTWTETVPATCTEDGLESRVCTVCGVYTETQAITALNHDFANGTVYQSYNNGTHAVKCARCDVYNPTTENCADSKEIVSTTAADCTHLGTTTYRCTRCGYVWTEENTGVGPHSNTPTHHAAVPATCTTAGNIEYWTCTICGQNFSDAACTTVAADVTVAALAHAGIAAVTQQDADCTHDGVKAHFHCPLCGKDFSNATAAHEVNAEDLKIPMLGHNFYGAMHDNGDGTHSFQCTRCTEYGNPTAHTFDRPIVNDGAHVSDADCLNPAKYHYSCACGAIDTEGTQGTFDNGQPTGHAYNTVKANSWVWTVSGDSYTAKATLTCANDSTHEIERNAIVTYTSDAPSCTGAGTRHYTATVTLDNGSTATDTKDEEVAVVGHLWSAPTFTWSDDGKTCTATRSCERANCSATETETATVANGKITSTEKIAATCTTMGVTTYTATFTNSAFAQQTKDVQDIPALTHDWGTPTYTWSDDGKTCTATRSCGRTGCGATETEIATVDNNKITSAVKTAATCTEMGTTTYTATFTNSAFEQQTKDVQDIAKTIHTLTETPAVTATCTVEGHDAYWTCSVCHKIFSDENGDHEIASVTTALDPDNHVVLVHTAQVDATCQADGNIEYWTCNACHQDLVYNNAGKLVATTDTVIPAGPEHHRFTTHVSAKAPTCTQQGNEEYWTCLICGAKYNADKSAQLENNDASIPALGHDFTGDNGHKAAVAATCTTDGNKEYWYCARCHQYFLANSITAEPVLYSETVIAALTHSPSAEVAAVAASCTEAGNKAYTYCTRATCDAILTIDGVDVSLNGWTKTGNPEKYTIPALGHRYGEPTWTWEGNPADGYTSATATFVCANDNSHTVTLTDSGLAVERIEPVHPENGKIIYTATVTFNGTDYSDTKEVAIVEGHHPVKVDAHDATCEAAGNREYWVCNDDGCGKLFLDANALVETTLADVTIPALGHNYVNPTWTWTPNGNLYSAATLTFTCANDEMHTQTPEVTLNSVQTDPDCTNAGKIVYTATATFDGETYTDTKEVALAKTGHTLVPTAAQDADCLTAGNIAYWTCSTCHLIFSDADARYEITADDTVIPALGHTYDYAHATYNWSADHASCTATATCIRCTATDTETKDSTNVVKIEATCEAQGIRVYTADFDNENFATQTYDELIPANGHGNAVPREGQANTCEAAGWEAYWTCSVCGKLFSDEELTHEIANPIVLPVLGHTWDYAHVDYDWSDSEPYTCTATVTCTRDESHTKEVTGSVTITASTEANCTTDGSRVYTATFPADTNIPNDTKTATTAALGHDFTASLDRSHVVDATHHNYKCVRCDAYGVGTGADAQVGGSVECTFQGDWLVSENESCTEPGSEWRPCAWCSNKETRARDALQHQVFTVAAQAATCVAIGNRAYKYCERCGLLLEVDGVSVESQNIKFNSAEAIALYKTEDLLAHNLVATPAKAATCEADGNTAYWTCSRCGKIFNTDAPASNEAAITLDSTVIPATKHDFTGTVRDNDDNTHSRKCTKCDAYGIMVGGTPVKDGKEACYGGTADCTQAATCTVCGHVYQAKLGHIWVLQNWTWNGYTDATAHYVCARNPAHTKDVDATVEKTDATVTCTEAGQNTYVATATFTEDGTTYTDTDTKTEVVNATGHNWDFEHPVNYEWDTNLNCTVTLKCLNDEDHVYTEVGSNTTETTPATCEGTGSVKYTASFTISNTLTSEHTETLAALGHKWGDPAWTWTGNDTDGYTATVKLVCQRVTAHEATPAVTVEKTVVAPTCEKDGRTVYTATATLDGRTYTDTKLTIQPALTHDWQAPVFTWTGNETDGYTAATALFACNNDHAHDQTLNCALTYETDSATCTAGGRVTYTATVTFNGVEYTDTKTATVAQLNHRYEFVDFDWSYNESTKVWSATVANFKCANDPTHTTTAPATVTSETVDAKCESDGKITYTATATFEGEDYTDTKVVVLPMLHHDWGEATYAWVKDGDQYQVTALRICANNPTEHQQTETVTTTSEITESSGCESEGTLLYTATFHDPFTTQYKEEAVAVTGHDLVYKAYLDSTCTEDGNKEYWRCSVCHKIFTDELASSTSYIGTDLAETVIPAKGHDFSGDAIDNGDGTHSFKCIRCDAEGAMLGGTPTLTADGGKIECTYGEWIVTKEPTCIEKGAQERFCSVCGHKDTSEIDYAAHIIVKVNAKDAACEATGNIEYFRCAFCGKLFSDEAATSETTLEAVTLPATGHNFTGEIRNNNDGQTHSYLCVNGCGKYGYEGVAGASTVHVFDQAIQSREYLRSYADCTTPSTYYKSCLCGEKSSEIFTVGAALGHNMAVMNEQPATCTQPGHSGYSECTRCHYREGYEAFNPLGHGAYNYDASKSGASSDGSVKWEAFACERGCGDYYMKTTITSLDANGARVPNVNVRIVDSAGATVVNGKTDANGDLQIGTTYRDSLHPGRYDVYLEYVRDGANYNTHGAITFADGKMTGSFGKLTPYGGNASGSIGGQPTGEFRCSMCDTYDSAKNIPVYGWFIAIIHAFVHAISRIGK